MSMHTADEAPSGAPPRVPSWTVGDRIRKARREADLSQQELADAIGVTVRRLGNWEAGYNKPEDVIATARAVARATGVRADWIAGLYTGDEEVSGVSARRSRRGGSLSRGNTQGYSRSVMRTRSSLLVRHPVTAS